MQWWPTWEAGGLGLQDKSSSDLSYITISITITITITITGDNVDQFVEEQVEPGLRAKSNLLQSLQVSDGFVQATQSEDVFVQPR